jgi:hypothetical protein
MFSCFNDPRVVMKQAFDNMVPGGWIEYQDSTLKVSQANPEFEGRYESFFFKEAYTNGHIGDAVTRWSEACIRGAAVMGRDIEVSEKYKGYLQEVGCKLRFAN